MVVQSIGTVPLTFIDDNNARIIVEIDIDVDQLTYNFMLFLAEPSSVVIIGLSHNVWTFTSYLIIIMSPYPSGEVWSKRDNSKRNN